jgi:hypothetical protein
MIYLKKLVLICTLLFSTMAFSQDIEEAITYGSAVIEGESCITLDVDSPLQEFYVADASALGFTTQAEMRKYCGGHQNNLVSLQEDFANNQILIRIHTDRTYDPKDLTWWNEYLQSICK